MHYNGTGSNSDFLCVATNLALHTLRKVLDDPGSGHRQVLARIVIEGLKQYQENRKRISWNFRKANWKEFSGKLEKSLRNVDLDMAQSPEMRSPMCHILYSKR